MGSSTPRNRPLLRRLAVSLSACVVAIAAGSVPDPAQARRPTVQNAEDLLIVDCLLPGQVRRLGAQATFMSPRRPVRTTQADCQIRGGEYVAHDRANYQTALRVWMEQATAGSAEAQNYVGEIYLKGLGTPPDYDMAAVWFRKAADQGFNRAKINLGYLYEAGLGVPADRTRALNLYREAAGVQNDELLFASEVRIELQARDAEIGSLRQTVESQREETAALRARVDELERQLGDRRRALQSAQGELQKVQAQLAEARQATGADFSTAERQRRAVSQREAEVADLAARLVVEREAIARREAQLAQQQAALRQHESAGEGDEAAARLREQVQTLSRAVDEARRRSEVAQMQLASSESALELERQKYRDEIARVEQEAAGRRQEDWDLMKLLESQLVQREQEIRAAQTEIAALTRQVSLGGDALLAAAPTLELIEPPLVLTRGRPAAVVRGGTGRQSLTGRVSQPQAVQSITVNQTPVILGDNGLFRASIEVGSQGAPVHIAATDLRGQVSTLEFTMMPPPGAASSGAGAAAGAVGGLPSGVRLGRYHAIVIGNNSYQAGWVPLQSAGNDATAVAQLLRERYGFQTNLLLNANRFQILSALNQAREALGADDNLLIYYAGHGEMSEDGRTGYWIPVDAQPGVSNSWVSNTAISEILETMQARQVLVVADSCYSGAMTRAALPVANAAIGEGKWDDWVRTMAAGRARLALTSGGLQPVPDTGTGRHSYFARAFLNALEDNNRLLEAQQLFREVTTFLALAAVDAPIMQVPEYSPIQFAGHENGEFFFLPTAAGRRTGP